MQMQGASVNPAAFGGHLGRMAGGGEMDSALRTLSDFAACSLRDDGFTCFTRLGDDAREGGFQCLLEAFPALPLDPYAEAAGRFRRYDHAVILPWEWQIKWIPAVEGPSGQYLAEYYQGSYNPEHPGERRAFPTLGDELRANPLLNSLIWHDFDLTFWGAHEHALPLHLGVHLVKLLVTEPDAVAISSPNMLHQDGERFTFAHLIARRNVLGGENVIAAPRCAGFRPEELAPSTIMATFDLLEPLDSYGVHDPRVSHYVGAVRQADPQRPAERSVVLIDFAVMATAI